jgi:phage terminase small subunit
MGLKIVSIGKDKEGLVKCPRPPMYLSKESKKHYMFMGNILAKKDRLQDHYLNALEVYAVGMSQFEFACREIEKKNAKEFGTGYIQTFKTGAQNISVVVTLRNDAIDILMKQFKIFGLDPKSDKELKSTTDPAQTSLFEELMKSKNG